MPEPKTKAKRAKKAKRKAPLPRPKRPESEIIAEIERKEREAEAKRAEHAARGRQEAERYAFAREGQAVTQLTRAQAVEKARHLGTAEEAKSRPFQQAFADRLVELGHAQPTSDGRRSGPSGPSGKHVNPDVRAAVPPELRAKYEALAERRGLNLAEWAREAFAEKAEREAHR